MALTKVRAGGVNLADTFAFTGTVTGASAVTVVDQWRLTSNFTTDGGTLSPWEQPDDVTFSNAGTSMTVSSGVFTFPSSGLYLVFYFGQGTNGSGDNSMSVQTKISSDSGSTYDIVTSAISGSGGQNYSVTSESLVNVTDASTFRCKFDTQSMGSGTAVYGDTNYNRTAVTFVRLADAQ